MLIKQCRVICIYPPRCDSSALSRQSLTEEPPLSLSSSVENETSLSQQLGVKRSEDFMSQLSSPTFLRFGILITLIILIFLNFKIKTETALKHTGKQFTDCFQWDCPWLYTSEITADIFTCCKMRPVAAAVILTAAKAGGEEKWYEEWKSLSGGGQSRTVVLNSHRTFIQETAWSCPEQNHKSTVSSFNLLTLWSDTTYTR